jgi:hypothetical protein
LLHVSAARVLVQAGLPLLVQMAPQAVRREQVLLLLTPLLLVDLRVAREWAGRAVEWEDLQAEIFRRCCRGFLLSRLRTLRWATL